MKKHRFLSKEDENKEKSESSDYVPVIIHRIKSNVNKIRWGFRDRDFIIVDEIKYPVIGNPDREGFYHVVENMGNSIVETTLEKFFETPIP